MTENTLAKIIQEHVHPLDGEKDLDVLMERIGNARIVMLGGSSHGTKDYYSWRSEISQRLIKEKDFSFIAVEGDWPDCYEVNRYVKKYKDSGENAEQVLRIFQRWPSWMWANEQVREFIEWMHEYNNALPFKDIMVGFYGLDMYSLWESMEVIIQYLKKNNDLDSLKKAYKAYKCFEPYSKKDDYTSFVDASCKKEVVGLLSKLKAKFKKYKDDEEVIFNIEQNARVVQNAEKYYRTMVRADNVSWNVRERHMTETLKRLIKYHGSHSKVIVWAHNTHVGDARATSMVLRGMLSIGQLMREEFGEEKVVLVGFGSHEGNVIAGSSWGAPMQKMTVPKAKKESWEEIFHSAGETSKIVITNNLKNIKEIQKRRGHRAIGVVYNPESDSNSYVPTDLVNRYDAFIYLDDTQAIEPLAVGSEGTKEVPETFPTGE